MTTKAKNPMQQAKKSKKAAGCLKAIKISDELTLVEQQITELKEKPVVVPLLNHILMIDVSGSMYAELPGLKKDVKSRLRSLKLGDTVSLGWFSGKGEYRFVVKGFKLEYLSDFEKLDRAIDDFTIRGLTCFSEILAESAEIVTDLKFVSESSTFAITFLTDGYPTVSPIDQEYLDIYKAIEKVKGKVAASLIVGYGDYYNKELLSKMATSLGGVLIHAEDLATFPVEYGLFLDRTRDARPMQEVEVDKKLFEKSSLLDADAFVIDGSNVRVLPGNAGKLQLSPSDDRVYYIVRGAAGVQPDGLPKLTGPNAERALYAAALVLTQSQRVDLALDVLGVLKDRAIITQTVNAFTNAEYGAAEAMMASAIGKPESRFIGGKVKAGFVPARDAFCMLDALDLLVEDEDAKFLPYDDAFDYKKIGPPTKTKPGYPKFAAESDVKTPFCELVWNEKMLNLSVRAKINGEIEVPIDILIGQDDQVAPDSIHQFEIKRVADRPSDLGAVHKTFIWRSYSFVKNGFCNVKIVPAVLGKESFKKLKEEGVIDSSERYYKNRVYKLNFRKIPVMNRQMATMFTSGTSLANLAAREAELEGKLKGLNWYLNELKPKSERTMESAKLSAEALDYLKLIGIRPDGSYGPPTETAEATDYYMANTFELKIKGLSSLPSVNDVKKKIESGKPFTLGQYLVNEGLVIGKAAYDAKDVSSIEGLIAGNKKTLKSIRQHMQRAKFAVILGKRWFEEFPSRTDCELKVRVGDQSDVPVVFALGEEKVEF